MGERVHEQWVRWGRELGRLRTLAGKSQGDVGSDVQRSRQQVGKLEKATRTPSRDDAQKLDTALATGGVLERLWLEAARAGGFPDEWRDFIGLERKAVEIHEYQMVLVPGLLQTFDYARMLLRRARVRRTNEQLDMLARNRTERLGALDNGPELWFVLDEIALTRTLGTPAVMRDQLDHLIRLIDAEAVKISLMPTDAPHHPGLNGAFRTMMLSNGEHVAHTDHLFGETPVSSPERVAACMSLFSNLLAEAQSPGRSAEHIRNIRKGFE
ncbi:helix-turn-helix domain-containing protein [Nocardiopsis suaedae]|uniref:Helix-turn-helix transcriptional regulator n=1 Tax=Nocardiopsis suaedae TaxID=3018444 RepID=A0ABT4TTJ2_9ACTN|nr:helix-turn-helix transcriptional regulator [Nocardiopsis suaedae]MDA2807574.1 helix-turn-helix transcriptional regulator [Nocardiopsis suaedae]